MISLIAILLAVPCVYSQSQDPEQVQAARNKGIKARATKIYYTKKFDLSSLPLYKPERKVSGTIRQWGSNYLADSPLGDELEKAFRKYQPEIKFEDNLKSTFIGMAGLYTGRADMSAMGRRPSWEELMAYQRIFNAHPLEIAMATGSYDVPGWTFALGIFVHKDNPLGHLTIEQLDGIFGAERTGGWEGTEWVTSVARGPEKNIRTWGQLGLTGEWSDKPINVYGYNINFHFPRDFAEKVFKGGYKWNEKMREYANLAKSDGSGLIGAGTQFMADLSKDKYGIAYTDMRGMTPQTKALVLANNAGGPYIELTLDNVQNRTYPLTREVYYCVPREKGKPIDPKVKEFVRFVLSREGQELVMKDGKYLPLTAEAANEQLKKLE
jgi:phosphate transport system substrate-binding protein